MLHEGLNGYETDSGNQHGLLQRNNLQTLNAATNDSLNSNLQFGVKIIFKFVLAISLTSEQKETLAREEGTLV